ncbi:MAG: hypothetical protein DIJKHBIC_02612 [Thermoanaerobaculia bacterium]|nr:hypothetical protein [Thermoanaerobaculia bacterium]
MWLAVAGVRRCPQLHCLLVVSYRLFIGLRLGPRASPPTVGVRKAKPSPARIEGHEAGEVLDGVVMITQRGVHEAPHFESLGVRTVPLDGQGEVRQGGAKAGSRLGIAGIGVSGTVVVTLSTFEVDLGVLRSQGHSTVVVVERLAEQLPVVFGRNDSHGPRVARLLGVGSASRRVPASLLDSIPRGRDRGGGLANVHVVPGQPLGLTQRATCSHEGQKRTQHGREGPACRRASLGSRERLGSQKLSLGLR